MTTKFITFCLAIFFCFTGIFAQTTEPIKVGVILDMTGSTSSFGISTYSAIKMAADEINAVGGVDNRKIEIFLEDGKGSVITTRKGVNELIKNKKIHAILGEATSTNTLAVAYLAQKAQVPMITPSATNPNITKIGSFIFRACFTDSFQGEVMAKFVFNELKLKKVAILEDSDSTYSKELAQSFAKTFTKLGGKIVARGIYVENEEDYGQLLQGIKTFKPEAIYVPGYYSEVLNIAQQSKELGIESIFLGGDGWDSPSLFEANIESLEGAYLTTHFSVGTPNEKVKTFVANHKKLYNLEPDSFAALGYDSMYLLAEAIKRAGTTDKLKLRDAIAKTRDFVGVTGKLSLNAYRDARKEVVMIKVKDQNFVYHSTIQP